MIASTARVCERGKMHSSSLSWSLGHLPLSVSGPRGRRCDRLHLMEIKIVPLRTGPAIVGGGVVVSVGDSRGLSGGGTRWLARSGASERGLGGRLGAPGVSVYLMPQFVEVLWV